MPFDYLDTPSKFEYLDETPALQQKQKGQGGFLPGLQKVKEQTATRPDSIQRLFEEFATPFDFKQHPIKRGILKAGVVTPLKMLAVPFQKAEAVLSNAALEAQQGNIVDIPKAIMEGIMGERQGEFGDLIRTTGFGGSANELLSSVTGFFGSMATGSLITKGKIVSGANKMETALKSKLPQVMGKDYVLNRTKDLVAGVDKLEEGIFDNYDDIYKAIGNNAVPQSISQADWWKNLPTKAISKIRTVLKVKSKEDIIPATVNSLKSVKQALRQSLSRKAWVMPDADDAKIIEAYFKTGEMISQNAGEFTEDLAKLNAKAKDFYLLRKELYNILLDGEGQPMANKLINLYKQGGERGKQVMFEKFSQFYPKAKDLIDDIIKFNRRQGVKKSITRAAPWIVGGAIGSAIAGKSISSVINRQE